MNRILCLFAFVFLLFATKDMQGSPIKIFKLSPDQSIEQMRDEIRSWRSADPARRSIPVEVRIPDGSWFFENIIDLGPKDGNVSWIAEGKTVFTRGKKITGWKINDRGWFEVDLPEVAQGKWRFEQLYVNGKRAVPASTPNEFYHYILDKVECIKDPASGKLIDTSHRAFTPRKSEEKYFEAIAKKDPVKFPLRDIQIKFYHSWATSLHRIESYDPKSKTVLLTGNCRWDLTYWGSGKLRYQIQGLKEALDQPGEFYLDRGGRLTYIPRKGETPENTTIIAPVGPCSFEDSGFFRILGDLDAITTGQESASEFYVSGIRFSGITFTIDPFTLPEEGLSSGQAATSTPVSILVEGARNIEITNCEFTHLGGYAIWFHRACSDCKVERNIMEDLGAGGIRIGTHLRDINIQKDSLITRRISARNNLIRGYGQIEGSAIGIWIGAAADNQILHNEIADGFYTAISVGWVWGYAKSRATGNKIHYNYLHHIGKGVLSDLGAIYTLGISPGTTINNNRIHDIYCFGRYGDGAAGLYTDEGSSDILFANNLVYKVQKGAIHQHYGKNNTFRNNIFTYSDSGLVLRSRNEDHLSFTLENNIFVWDKSPLFYRSWNRPTAYILKKNLYWFVGDPITDEDKEQKFFVGKTFADWQKSGMDQGSLWADPGFVDSKNYDFHFKGDTPNDAVRAIGFQPFDIDLSGVEKEIREGWGKRYSDYRCPDLIIAPDPPLPPPLSLNEDFEKPRFNPLPNAKTPDKPFKQTYNIKISPVQKDGSSGMPILSENKAVMNQSTWNRLDWFGFCANGSVNASIDLDNINIKGTQKDHIPYLFTEDFSTVRTLPVPNTKMSMLHDKIAWSILSDQGNNYLRINDSDRFRAAYDPHFYYQFKDLVGKIRISYDVRLSQDAFLYTEAREYKSSAKYLSGPSLSFSNGKIILPTKESIPFDINRWYRIELEFDQDQGAFPPYEIKEEGGNHFVRLNDDPRFQNTFSPFFYYDPNYSTGIFQISFKVRLSKDANLVLEGRNLDSPYKIGPNISLRRGKMIVHNKAICDYPEDQWIAFSLKWDLASGAPKTWNLDVSLCNSDGSIGKTLIKSRNYPLRSKDISSLNQFYFIGAGFKKGTIDLDDIQIHQ